jgi:hypothetical protein
LRGILQNKSITFEERNDEINHGQPMKRETKANQAYNRRPINYFQVPHRFHGIDNAKEIKEGAHKLTKPKNQAPF